MTTDREQSDAPIIKAKTVTYEGMSVRSTFDAETSMVWIDDTGAYSDRLEHMVPIGATTVVAFGPNQEFMAHWHADALRIVAPKGALMSAEGRDYDGEGDVVLFPPKLPVGTRNGED